MSRRAREQRRRVTQRSLVDRYGYRLVSVAVVLGVVAVGAYIYLQSTRPAYACESLLMAPAATPTPIATATPGVTPVPTESPTPEPTATPSPTAEPTATPEPTPRLGFVVTDRGRNHVQSADRTIRYLECPPTSGPHYADVARRGFYEPEERLPVGAWVHSLEHGMVAVLYSCGPEGNACPDAATLDALRTLANTAPQTEVAAACGIANKIIVARFDEMSTRFGAVGWNRAMLSDTYDAETFLTFYTQWVDNSPTEEARGCDGPTGAE